MHVFSPSYVFSFEEDYDLGNGVPIYEFSAKIKFLPAKQMLFTVKSLARIETKTTHFRSDICCSTFKDLRTQARSKLRRRS